VLEDVTVFEEFFGGSILVVTFDDVKTGGYDAVFIEEDRYLASHGIVIRGQDGQYAGPIAKRHYDVFSEPNAYAPGPFHTEEASGGNHTDITFWVNGRRAAVAGFGAFFCDADLPSQGASSLAIFGKYNQKLGNVAGFRGPDRSHLFRGIVLLDEEGALVPAIYKVRIVNGSGWAGRDDGEGVILDDFIYPHPILRDAGPNRPGSGYVKRSSTHGAEQPLWVYSVEEE